LYQSPLPARAGRATRLLFDDTLYAGPSPAAALFFESIVFVAMFHPFATIVPILLIPT
jgi:hypothetical protein